MPTLLVRHNQLRADQVTSRRYVSDVGHLTDSLAGVLIIGTSVYIWQSGEECRPKRSWVLSPVRYSTDDRKGCIIWCFSFMACSSLSKWNASPVPGL